MRKEKLYELLLTMAKKAALCNMAREEGAYKDHFRQYPIFSELKGMETALKILGIDFDYEFNTDSTKITAVKANDIYIKVS